MKRWQAIKKEKAMCRETSQKVKRAAVTSLMLTALLLGLTPTAGCEMLSAAVDPLAAVAGNAGVGAKPDQRSGINMHGFIYRWWWW